MHKAHCHWRRYSAKKKKQQRRPERVADRVGCQHALERQPGRLGGPGECLRDCGAESPALYLEASVFQDQEGLKGHIHDQHAEFGDPDGIDQDQAVRRGARPPQIPQYAGE